MELPIDHFRLLGVNPSCDTQTVLRTLQQRLDRPPQEGFTQEGLQARAELLRASAELLSDQERRQHYETELTSLHGLDSQGRERIPGLEIPTSRELGGLVLLLEADQPLEAFELGSRCLEPPQAPALGSGREADLTLLAALACEAAANSLHQQRRFETAAGVLQQGIQLLQRMGQLPERRQRLALLREALLPYRVLDLLSRDLAATADRQEGLQLLEQLVLRRGGLEGDRDPAFSRHEFQDFFAQIRQFLTVQEQVDLFSRWAADGSAESERLTTLALTASGFAQRKPERLASACERLVEDPAETAGASEPSATTWLRLLLGQVEKVPQLQGEQAQSLAELCQQCRHWLNREVLPGYRDVDADADLEAWFADRDVQAWIERQDRRDGRLSGEPASTGVGAGSSSTSGSWPPVAEDPFAIPGAAREPFVHPPSPGDTEEPGGGDQPHGLRPRRRRRLQRPFTLPPLPALQASPWLVAGGMALALALAALMGVLRQRQAASPAPTAPAAKPPAAPAEAPARAPAAAPRPPTAAAAAVPLRIAAPSEAQVEALLASWLKAKAAVLAGGTAALPLEQMATAVQVQRLTDERRADAARGLRREVDARIERLEILERTPFRIATAVDLRYSERRLGAGGETLGRSADLPLRNGYVFSREGGVWRLASYRPLR